MDEKLDKLFKTIRTIELIPTEGCNMRCTYCYQHRNSNKVITNEVVDKLLETLKKYPNIDHITLFGGEPIQRHTIPRLRKIFSNWNGTISIVSNGYDGSDDVMNFYREFKDRLTVQISLDGINEMNDNRVNIYGHSTYKQVVENMIKISEIIDGHVSIHSVMTNDSLKDFPRFLRQLEEWYDNKIIKSYRFSNEHNESFEYDKDLLREAFRFYIHEFIEDRVSQNMFRRQFSLENYPSISSNETQCGVFKKFISLLPNGDLLSCHFFVGGEKDQIVGNLLTGQSNENFDKIENSYNCSDCSISPFGYDCSTCEARFVCHRCPASSVRHNDNKNINLRNMCNFYRMSIDIIKEVYPDMNIFKKPDPEEMDELIDEINELSKYKETNKERYDEIKHILKLKGWWLNENKRNK